VTLTFDLWSQKLISTTNPNTSVTKIRRNSLYCFFEICCSQSFSGHCLLWPWPLTFCPQNLISISVDPNTYVTKIRRNSLHRFFRHGVHSMSAWVCESHSKTDRPEYSMPPVPFIFNGGGRLKLQRNHWQFKAVI